MQSRMDSPAMIVPMRLKLYKPWANLYLHPQRKRVFRAVRSSLPIFGQAKSMGTVYASNFIRVMPWR